MNSEEYNVDWALIAVRLFICIAGLVGNLLVIFVILILQEYKKTVTHWYVLQLAIADSIFLLTLPFKVSEDIQNEWIYPGWMCKAKETVLFLNYYASICFLVIMSVDRYVAVCHATSDWLQKFRSHYNAYAITGVTWVLCLVICVPIMLYSDKRGTEPNCRCSYEFPVEELSPEEFCLDQGYTLTDTRFPGCVEETERSRALRPTQSCQSKDEINNAAIDHGFVIPPEYGSIDEILKSYEMGPNLPAQSTKSTTVSPAQCNYDKLGNGWNGFLIFNFTVMFLVPLFIMIFCYSMIIVKIQQTKLKSNRHVSYDNANSSVYSNDNTSVNPRSSKTKRKKSLARSRANAERNRVTIMCAVLVALFLVCWLPFHSVHLAKIKGMYVKQEDTKWCTLLPVIASLIVYMNSALNPYLYNFLGTKFGRRLRDAGLNVRYTVRRKSSSSSVKTVSKDKTVATKVYKGSITQADYNAVNTVPSDTEKEHFRNGVMNTPPVYRADTNTFETPTEQEPLKAPEIEIFDTSHKDDSAEAFVTDA